MLNLLNNASEDERVAFDHKVEVMTAAAPPPAAVIARMEAAGFHVTHVYGLTEVYGPVTVCDWHDEWNALPLDEQAALKARQGVPYATLDGLMVADSNTLEPVPADGETMGEVFMRGNTVMKGYLHNPQATEEAFAGGWFHTGDLGVVHADGYIQLKDRAKDIIISGGENISTIEVEGALYRHPAVLEAAVVARPDETWGETPCAFVTLKDGAEADEAGLIDVLPGRACPLQVPEDRRLRRAAQDVDRQDPQVRAQGARRRALKRRPMTRATAHLPLAPSSRGGGGTQRGAATRSPSPRRRGGEGRGEVGALASCRARLRGPARRWPRRADDAFAEARAEMVRAVAETTEETAEWIGKTELDAPEVMEVMGRVPRHLFVPPDLQDMGYLNRPLPIGYGQTISQPYIVALMTDLLEPEPGDVAFELGTGSSYQAAMLAELVAEVYTVEIVPPLAESAAERLAALGYDNVTVRAGDGYFGWPEHAPFDIIVVTAAASHVPPPLIAQLKPGGRMVIPVGSPSSPSTCCSSRRGRTAASPAARSCR